MCYNAAYELERSFKYAIRSEMDPVRRAELERMYGDWKEANPDIYKERHQPGEASLVRHFVSGFEHAPFPVMYERDGLPSMGFFRWGLVPRWCRDEQKAVDIMNKTINARSETLFEKPSFRASALDRRCIVFLSGFFEYHHYAKRKYPFFISMADGDVMPVGALWDRAVIDGETWETFTIITVDGNESMKEIHNNPKNPNRMPLILKPNQFREWLAPTDKEDTLTPKALQSRLMQPFPSEEMKFKTVPPLIGKQGVGDVPEAQVAFPYMDLDIGVELTE